MSERERSPEWTTAALDVPPLQGSLVVGPANPGLARPGLISIALCMLQARIDPHGMDTGSNELSLCFFLFVNDRGNVENSEPRRRLSAASAKRLRAEESVCPLSLELVLKVALPPVYRVHLVQDRAHGERIAARVRDPAAGLPMEGSHER